MAIRELVWSLKAEDSASRVIKDVDKDMDGIKSKIPGISKGFEDVGNKLKGMGGKFSNAGKKLDKFSVPLIAAGTAGVKMAMDLDEGFRKVSTLADQSILPVDRLKKEVRELSDVSGIAQGEITESIYSALSAGVQTEEVMAFVASGIDLTRAGFTDMETVIDATTTVLNAYGDAAYDTTKIHDIFVQTQDKGKISVDELGQNIGRVIPAASSLGVNIDQLGASYAILTAKGQNANIATTNLTALFNELGKSGSIADETLKEVTGKTFKQLTDEGKNTGEVLQILDDAARKSNLSLKDMFGNTSAGAAALTLLSDGVEGYNQSLQDMHDAEGKTAENSEKMKGDLHTIREAFNKLKNVVIDAGVALAPMVTSVAEKLGGLVEKFNSLDAGTQGTIMKFLGLAAISAPVSKGIGGIFTTVGNLSEGVGGFIGKLPGLGTKLGTVAGGVTKFGSSIMSAGKIVLGFVAANPMTLLVAGAVVAGVALIKNWDKIKEVGSKATSAMSEKWSNMKAVISEKVTGKVELLKDKFESGLKTVKDKWEGLKKFFRNPIQGTVDIIQNTKDKLKSKKNKNYDVGTTRVTKDQSANIHEGETILPKKLARQYRALGGTRHKLPQTSSGGGNQSIFSPTINVEVNGNGDGREIAQAVRNELDLMFRKMNLQYT